MRASILTLNRSTYDKGKVLYQRGEVAKALEHYEQAGSLTVSQKFNRIEILKDNKDYNQVEKFVNEMIASY